MARRSGQVVTIDVVIPARGGSSRLPGKNLAVVGGHPLVAHSIRFALDHPLVRDVYVSTDSPDIAAVARHYGATVLDRPADLASDDATISGVLVDALDQIRRLDPTRDEPDAIATLQPTSPLRLPHWLDECAERLTDPAFDSAATVSPVTSKVGTVTDHEFTPLYAFESRSQDMPQRYRENGAIYLTRAATVARGSVFGDRVGAVVTDHLYATIDIDTEADLAYAETVMELTA